MVFLFVILAIIVVIIILMFSKIKIEIKNFELNTNAPTMIGKDYVVKVKFFILGIIPILKINITRAKLEKFKIKEKARKLELKLIENREQFDKKMLTKATKISKELDLNIKNLELEIKIGTENAGLTAIVVAFVSTIISIHLAKKIENPKLQRFEVIPIYINKNFINIQFSGIFEIKMLHIINIIYILMKSKGEDRNERTSNRRTYDYSYE